MYSNYVEVEINEFLFVIGFFVLVKCYLVYFLNFQK